MEIQKKGTNSNVKNTINESETIAGRDITIGDTNNYYNYTSISFLVLCLVLLTTAIGIYFYTSTKGQNIVVPKESITDETNSDFPLKSKAEEIQLPPTERDKPKDPVVDFSKNEKPSTENINDKPLIVKNQNEITKEEKASDYLDVTQNVEIALFNSNQGEFTSFREVVKSKLKSNQIKFSNSFFRPKFIQQFGSSILDFDIAKLEDIGINKRLKCICQIDEAMRIEESEEEGMIMYTAYSDIVVHILNLKTGELKTIPFDEKVAGMTKSGAKENLKELLLESKSLELINTKPCK